ncbi:hypothetical protein FJ251_03415 [bacterium]|nr:hypothetical protein [bacterium]
MRVAPSRRFRALSAALLLGLGACSEGFEDVEMHLGLEGKTRPLAILCEPPEAAPGDTVRVSLYLHSPDPASCAVAWRVALDYDLGPYGADEIERHLLPLSPPPPVDEALGFLRQDFVFVVPDSALLFASSLRDPLEDPGTIALAEALLPAGTPSPPPKAAVDAYLAGLDPAELAALPPASQAAALALADRFACRLRFRAAISSERYVEVTRTLTVRHSARLGSPNANRNPGYSQYMVLAIPHPDVAFADRLRYESELQVFAFPATPEAGAIAVPARANWTYYLTLTPELQFYTSPLGDAGELLERSTLRWYYFAVDAPTDAFPLFRDDAGDPAEMWALDENVRLVPPTSGEHRYRLVCCLRDSRPEWDHYGGTPGLTLALGELVFTPPTGAAPSAGGGD